MCVRACLCILFIYRFFCLFVYLFDTFVQQVGNVFSITLEVAEKIAEGEAGSKPEARRAASAILIKTYWPESYNPMWESYISKDSAWRYHTMDGYNTVRCCVFIYLHQFYCFLILYVIKMLYLLYHDML